MVLVPALSVVVPVWFGSGRLIDSSDSFDSMIDSIHSFDSFDSIGAARAEHHQNIMTSKPRARKPSAARRASPALNLSHPGFATRYLLVAGR